MPLMVTYMLGLLVISVLTVAVSIIVVRLHHSESQNEEKEEPMREVNQTFPVSLYQIGNSKQIPPPSGTVLNLASAGRRYVHQHAKPPSSNSTPSNTSSSSSCSPNSGRSKVFAKRLELISLIVFSLTWLGLTLGFFIKVTT
ncbi:hypothetical protein EGW08_007906 [Elysia chlorotica]|uniref:Uncharacterized protein n=1 Tax=Elysia chlorotica TaxID=188477 RepID=A0A3S0ZVY7_ELYCH|nr:hypothetical protein EGW08_007906 [Elysia chlorotica]